MRADWEQEKPLARVVFELGQVSLEGDPEFLARLEQGIPDETDQLIFPKDGMRFLLAVQSYFSNPPHLFATEIHVGEQKSYVPTQWEKVDEEEVS